MAGRQAFSVFQLMTILEESRHSLIVIEHDPMLYEDAQGMVEYVSQGLHDAAKEAAVLLYSPGTDTFLEDMTKNADRVFYFDEGPRATTKLISKAYPKAHGFVEGLNKWLQITIEFSMCSTLLMRLNRSLREIFLRFLFSYLNRDRPQMAICLA